MATLGPPSPAMSPSMARRSKSCARRCERSCCNVIMYFPIVIVYALTTWAVWVQATVGFLPGTYTWIGYVSAFVGIVLYLLLNWSYTTAVFTDPGSPMNTKNTYASLPDEESSTNSLTVKSSGELRFCKKCQTRKPDRAHHCSTCRRCVMKMDHHCPWLATCVGLHNYKPFILFLVYTCLFCYVCFISTATWVWREIVDDVHVMEDMMPVNYILLAVISGIIGLVLGGFTGWHLYLACKGRTTIESLEKTRYLAPVRKSMQQQLDARRHTDHDRSSIGDQLMEIHANALPGVTRPEEGEERGSPAQDSLRKTYLEMEHSRERERYEDYLSEQDSEKLPNAFDLGWRRNLKHVFGENTLLWWLPICNTTGDGWEWEISPKWHEAHQAMAKEREARRRENEVFDRERGWQNSINYRASPTPYRSTPPGRSPNAKPLSTVPSSAEGDSSSDEDEDNKPLSSIARGQKMRHNINSHTENWNDLPDDFLKPPSMGRGGPRSRSPNIRPDRNSG